MKRAFILLFDSFGLGASPDAAQFGDELANTFGHIAECCASGHADADGRSGRLHIPNLTRLGLNAAYENCHGEKALLSDACTAEPEALYGYAQEISRGKDTPSGHWEIAGVPVLFDWGYFPEGFPKALIKDFMHEANVPGVLGNKHASGTEIINELGDEHIRTGKPILYTSGDSVFQLACHEKHFGLDRLHHICEVARQLVNDYNVGRVIARPFLGDNADYHRTANRRDYSTPPPGETLLDKLKTSGGHVTAIGKVADIYAHHGISQQIKADGNLALFDALLAATQAAKDRELVFVNFVDFDSKYGHRRNVTGYAKALEELDARLPEFEALLQPGDLAVITADHGCDPTMPGSDHTREYIPVLTFGPGLSARPLGCLETFADIGQSLARHLDLSGFEYGNSFLR